MKSRNAVTVYVTFASFRFSLRFHSQRHGNTSEPLGRGLSLRLARFIAGDNAVLHRGFASFRGFDERCIQAAISLLNFVPTFFTNVPIERAKEITKADDILD